MRCPFPPRRGVVHRIETQRCGLRRWQLHGHRRYAREEVRLVVEVSGQGTVTSAVFSPVDAAIKT